MVPLEYGVEDGAVLLDGGAVDCVLDEEVGVRQRLDLLVVVEVGEDADAQLLVLALHGAGQGLLQGSVHVAPAAKMVAKLRKQIQTLGKLQSGASDHSLGFEDEDLGSSPGWWAATVATYSPSRLGELPKFLSSKPCE